jgi:hypothetical protein
LKLERKKTGYGKEEAGAEVPAWGSSSGWLEWGHLGCFDILVLASEAMAIGFKPENFT